MIFFQKKLLTNSWGKYLMYVLFLTCTVSFSSCNDDNEDSEEANIFEMLQGTWETTHVVENDEGDTTDRNIQDENDEFYLLLNFDQNRKVTILAWGDPEDLQLPATFNFKLSGNRIYGVPFQGDEVEYMTVTFQSENVFTLTMNETDYNIEYTFKKQNK